MIYTYMLHISRLKSCWFVIDTQENMQTYHSEAYSDTNSFLA